MDLSVILPTRDRGPIFSKTFDRLLASSRHVEAEIIVVNNSPSRRVEVPDKPANVTIVDNPRDKDSVFSARNHGASLATADILLFVDDDILLTRDSIDAVLRFHETYPSACLNVHWEYPPELLEKARTTTFGRFLIRYGFTSMKVLYGPAWRDEQIFRSTSVASFFLAIRRSDFMKIGGYNEQHRHEGTDVDLTDRCVANGITMYIDPLTVVHHNEEDRVDISGWLERKRRVGMIHAHATRMGDTAHRFSYSMPKRWIFAAIYRGQPLLIQMLTLFPRNGVLDPLGFTVIKALLGANLCAGYTAQG